MSDPAPKLSSVAPVFLVSDLMASAKYYRDRLGFTHDRYWGEPPSFVMVHRDGFTIMLAQHSHGERPGATNPNGRVTGHEDQWDASIWVENLEALHDEVKAAGATISVELHDQPYGMREFQVADPDGYQIVFGAPL
jgi:catechol 2,3-dioxygenase-like lactoylglutathione lyase family enzyme